MQLPISLCGYSPRTKSSGRTLWHTSFFPPRIMHIHAHAYLHRLPAPHVQGRAGAAHDLHEHGTIRHAACKHREAVQGRTRRHDANSGDGAKCALHANAAAQASRHSACRGRAHKRRGMHMGECAYMSLRVCMWAQRALLLLWAEFALVDMNGLEDSSLTIVL